ncbi:MAG: hypothetical protein JXO22_15590, partial [Phycisphaerae bacterium]|nr:hypothetical protein [Phycisphaerae bacterium]
EYLVWYGCSTQEELPDHIDHDSFSRLSAVLIDVEMSGPAQETEKLTDEQAPTYFSTIRTANWGNPARYLHHEIEDLEPFDPPSTVEVAIANLHGYLERYARLGDDNPNPAIREWDRIRALCAEIQDSYLACVNSAGSPIGTRESLVAFAQKFGDDHGRLTAAIAECQWRLKQGTGFLRIPSLRDLLMGQRAVWTNYQESLTNAYAQCLGGEMPPADDPIVVTIGTLSTGRGAELRGLDLVLADSMKAAGLASMGYYDKYFTDFGQLVREVDEMYAHIIAVNRAGDAPRDDVLTLSTDLTGVIMPVLDKINTKLGALDAGKLEAATAAEWIASLQAILYPQDGAAGSRTDASQFAKLNAGWVPDQLAKLDATYLDLVRMGEGTVLLRSIETRLGTLGTWGTAELANEWRDSQRSAYYIAMPAITRATPAPTETTEPSTEEPTRPGGPPPVIGPGAAQPAAPPVTVTEPADKPPAPADLAGTTNIPVCATADFLNARAMETVQLIRFLNDFGPQYYLERETDSTPLNQRCADLVQTAWQNYCQQYVKSWSDAYGNKQLKSLDKVSQFGSWQTFAEQFKTGATRGDARAAVRDELQPALSEVLRAVRWATYMPNGGWWLDQQDEFYGRQKRLVGGTYASAIRDYWGHGSFASEATAGSTLPPNAQPWDAVANEFADAWSNWSSAVGNVAVLPRRFGPDDPVSKAQPISWGAIANLRVETNLSDESMTGALVQLEQRAQNVLNAELTNIFHGIQSNALQSQATYEGWPYTNPSGTGLTALETVNFDTFTSFLAAVQRANGALSELDKGLPDDAIHQTRRTFISSCDQWQKFIGSPTPLDVEVWNDDPLVEPYGKQQVSDRAQFYYTKVRLTLGLRLPDTGDAGLEFRTTERGQSRSIRCVWEWRRPQVQELTFELVDGIQPEGQDFHYPRISGTALGAPAPLSFCAYLHRYGNYSDGNWVVSHGVDLGDKFKEVQQEQLLTRIPQDKRTVGEKFIFHLPAERNLPAPIQPLSPASGN